MRASGLRGASKRKYVTMTIRDKRQRSTADLLDQNFYADAPNVLLVADITFVPTWTGSIYLEVVLDAFSRRIVGWAIGHEQKAELVLQALNIAVTQRKPRDVIHHSDSHMMVTSSRVV
jgi:putative transposase